MRKIYSLLLMATLLLVSGNAWANASSAAALPAATGSGTEADPFVITLGVGEYKTGTDYDNKYVKIIGAGAENTTLWYGQLPGSGSGEGGSDYNFEGAHLTIVDAWLRDVNGDKVGYDGFVRLGSGYFEGCKFTSMITYLGGNSAIFKGCTFVSPGTEYCLWIYGIKEIQFIECEMNIQGKFANCYIEGANKGEQTIVMQECNVESTVANKAILNLKNSNNWDLYFFGDNNATLTSGDSYPANGTTGTAFFQIEAGTQSVEAFVGNAGATVEDAKVAAAENNVTFTNAAVSSRAPSYVEPETYVPTPTGPDFTVNEIVITTPAELVALSAYVNDGHNMASQTVKLGNDIDMTGVEFTPISQSNYWFAGVFDGQGYTIKNLTVNTPSTNRAALFGGLSHGTVKNFTLENPQIQGGADYTAAVCASGNGTIDSVTVKGGSVKGADQVGGIAGFMIATTIKHCTLDGTTIEATGDRAGGIIGKIDGQNSFHIDNNTLIGVTVKAAAKHGVCGAGGIASQLMTNTVASGMSIKNNEIQVTTITAGVEEFVPIANLRDGYSIDPVNETNICKNHWIPETVASTTISNGTSSVTFDNFVPVAKIGDEGYATLADAFAAVPADNTLTTIELLADCAGSGIVVGAGQNVTVNFNNHTYTVNQAPLAGSAGTKNQCFQLLSGATVVFNNGTIVADNTDVKMIIQNYANLTLNNMVLDATVGTNSCKYALSTNNGETKIIDTEITARYGEVAFDVCGGWGGYESNVVTVSGTSVISGKIEISQYNETATETLTLAGGDFTNAEIVVDQANGGEQVTVTKAADAEVTAPEGYKWEDNTLVPDLTTVRTGLASGLLAGLCEKKQIVRVEGATLYDIEYFDGFYVHFVEHQGAVVAGQPVIYQADGGDIKVQLVGEDAAEAGHNNGLYGTFTAMIAGSLTGYYAMVNNQVRLLGDGATMGAGKAYIVLGEITTEQPVNAPVSARRLVVGAERVTTGMEMNEEASAATKMVINGELYIIRGSQMFNAAGQMQK